ncbi:protein snakeskin-like [Schistocerca nitens]|uniref:protein snakeskin-like n=1 Tax=Schistocerca nitens TaxID=7011 RepID=UPI0021194532|nr:protein snakeskin-like [Schistocerca nitens]
MSAKILSIASIFIKLLKLVLNFIALLLYRLGYDGMFLGVGGTWNINENKDPSAEVFASGIMVGYLVYTCISLVGMCLHQPKTITDVIMNFIGLFVWMAVGAIAIQYWMGYQSEYKYIHMSTEKQKGLAVGALCVLSGTAYLLDTVVSFLSYAAARNKY